MCLAEWEEQFFKSLPSWLSSNDKWDNCVILETVCNQIPVFCSFGVFASKFQVALLMWFGRLLVCGSFGPVCCKIMIVRGITEEKGGFWMFSRRCNKNPVNLTYDGSDKNPYLAYCFHFWNVHKEIGLQISNWPLLNVEILYLNKTKESNF